MKITRHLRVISLLNAGLAVILLLVPFHAFLSVWAGHLFGHYEYWRVWKDLVLLVLIPFAAVLLWRHRAYWRELDTRWIFWASICYLVLQVGLGALAYWRGYVNKYAVAFALDINLRFLLMFWLCLIAASQSAWLKRHWRPLLLGPAVPVVLFGLLQFFVLPADFLHHFGYGPGTIVPYETVDQKLSYIRVQSFLRGSNPLGAYLVLIATATALGLARIITMLTPGLIARALLFAGSLLVLITTYSRSAYLGVALSLGLMGGWALRRHVTKLRLAALAGVLVVVCGTALLTLRHNDRFQNVFFHTDEHSHSQLSSNAGREGALKSGLHDVLTEPFGRGPGTAGPASLHNTAPGRIAENYYLQVGQETGWLGLGLFLAINIMVGIKLWRQRQDGFSRMLLASLIGLSLVNLVSHAWADDTLSLLWWGLAGIGVARAILPRPSKAEEEADNGKTA